MKENCFKSYFCSKEGFNKGCHSQVFLLGIFRILSSYAKKEKSLCDNDRYVEDPRLQASGMTALWNGAFTLIELLVVVLIIGILAAVAVPQYQKVVERSKATEAMNILSAIAKAYEVYYLANGKYATKFAELDMDIPATGNTEVVYINSQGGGDTKSNKDWSFQIQEDSDVPGSGYVNLFAIRIDGKYKGAGLIFSVDNSAHNAKKQIRCMERKSAAYVLFDTNLSPGAYCEQVMRGRFASEDQWTRSYAL